jgi:hypothetical protein
MSYTLGQAARAAGKSKPTIARAIQAGQLWASRTDSGAFVIDPASLLSGPEWFLWGIRRAAAVADALASLGRRRAVATDAPL